jgi:arginine utilization regulatory protein
MNFSDSRKISLEDLPDKIINYKENQKNKEKKDEIDNKKNKSEALKEYKKEGIQPLNEVVEKIERELIVEALRETDGNKSAAARLLKIPRQTLSNKIDKYNIVEKYKAE